jgi:outer membrane protein OmpA-like peptidoglycan-associated protein
MKHTTHFRSFQFLSFAAFACLVMAVGCAKDKAPTALLDQAKSEISAFEQNATDPAKYSGYEQAVESYNSALEAVEEKEYPLAERDAKLALTSIELAKTNMSKMDVEMKSAKALALTQSKLMQTESELQQKQSELESEKTKNQSLVSQLRFMEAKETERGVMLTLRDMMFGFDEANLTDGARKKLVDVAKVLKQTPDRRIVVEGHTDSVGSDEYNQSLSEKRALSVKSQLIREDIKPGRIEAKGLGEEYPKAPNSTEAGRQENRRVEITILND